MTLERLTQRPAANDVLDCAADKARGGLSGRLPDRTGGVRLSQNSVRVWSWATSNKAMTQPIAADYGQQFLFPLALEDWVPQARRMKVGDTNRYAYNAQAIADEKEKIIVACEATRQENDVGQLTPMMEQARQNLGVAATDTLTVADTGYGSGGDLQAAQDKQFKVLAPPPEGNPAKDKHYATQRFRIDPWQ